MQDLTNISLDDNADIRVVDSNFDIVKAAIDNVESDISNLREDLADYIGSFNTKADLDAYSGALSNNDWAVVLDDETHSNQCWRYIYNATTSTWLPQFMINETPLTQTQWNAVNSGITAALVTQIGTNTTDIAGKQDQLTTGDGIDQRFFERSNIIQIAYADPSSPTPSTTNPYNASQVHTLLSDKQDTLTAGTGINITNNVISATNSGSDGACYKYLFRFSDTNPSSGNMEFCYFWFSSIQKFNNATLTGPKNSSEVYNWFKQYLGDENSPYYQSGGFDDERLMFLVEAMIDYNPVYGYIDYRGSSSSSKQLQIMSEDNVTEFALYADSVTSGGIPSTAKWELINVETKDERITRDMIARINSRKQDELTAGTGISIDSNNVISATSGGGSEPIETTYANLVSLINNSQLVVGQLYRITDYSTFVNSSYNGIAQTADHQFDVIVEAVATNKLLSDAKAAVHSGTTYFQYEELDSWELKYDINNDTSKYDWADTNGKGVIYYMKDNHNNVCSYDFKNIMFMRYSDPNYNNYYTGVPYKEYDSSVQTFPSGLTGSTKSYYTFSYSDSYLDFDSSRDLSVNWDSDPQIGWNSNHRRCEDNIIKTVYFQDGMADSPLTLNNVVIFQFGSYGISGHYYDIAKNSSIVMSPAGWDNGNLVQNSYLQYFCGTLSGSYIIDSNIQGFCNIEISGSILVKSNGGNTSSPYLNGANVYGCLYLSKNFSVASGESLSYLTAVGVSKYQISFSLDGALFSDGVTRIVKFNYTTARTIYPYTSGQTINRWFNMSFQGEFTSVNGIITKNTETNYTPITIYLSGRDYMDEDMVVMQYGSNIIDIGQATPVGDTINITPI